MRKTAACILVLLSVLFAFVSCDPEVIEVPVAPKSPAIRGTVSIPKSATGLAGDDFFVRVMEGEKAVYTGKVNEDGSFAVEGLDESKTYSILITTEEPGDINDSSRALSRATDKGFGGWLSNVTASMDEKAGVGSIKVKPLGTIKGSVKKDGSEDHYDTMVYIPGTSFMAMTDGEGNFSMTNVPQSQNYTLRYSSSGYLSQMKSGVVLYSESDTENPVTTVSEIRLVKNAGTLKGTVIKSGSTDSSNITILLENGKDVFNGTTNQSGDFTIAGISPGTYTVTISSSGFVTQKVENVTIEVAKTTVLDSKVLTANGGTISGSVSFNDGSTNKAGVLITARSVDDKYSYTTSTDANGTYTFSNVYPGEYTLTFTKAGYSNETKAAVVIVGDSTVIDDLSLQSLTGSLKVTVGYSDTSKTSGITVSVYNGEAKVAESTTTNILTLSFTDLAIGTYRIVAEADGYASAAKADVSVTSANETAITVPPLTNRFGTVTGKVTDTKGNAIENAIVKIGDISVFTDSDGNFSKTGIAVGAYTVSISKDGYTTQTLGQTVTVESSKTTNFGTIKLASVYGTVIGTIFLDDGSNAAGTFVSITDGDANTYSALADSNGAYRISEVVPGEYDMTISKDGYSSYATSFSVSADGTVELAPTTLSAKSGSAQGRVTLRGSIDYSGVSVTLMLQSDPSRRYSTTTLADGTWVVNRITEEGTYSISISKTGHVTDNSASVNVEYGRIASAPTVELAKTTSTVRGTATLSGMAEHAGIQVLLKADDNSVQYDTTTATNGSFVLNDVLPGKYSLILSSAGYVSQTITDITVGQAVDMQLDAKVLEVGTRSITGSVTLELLADHSGALITATNLSDPTLVYSAITNSAGAYTLAGMKPGEYSITVSCTNYSTTTLPTIDVIDGSTRTLDPVNLPIARGTISGSATLEGRGSNAGITVELMKGTDVYATTTTDDSGLYSFRVPQGNYSGVRLSCEDFRSVSIAQSIALIANDYVTIEGGTTNMVATHVPVVRGRLTVRGLLSLDFSGIRVSIDGTEISTTTDKDGYWSFSKVPVGNYTLRFERENTNVVTKAIDVVAAAEKVVEDLELIPNAASIEGHVTLNGMTDHSNITVRATAPGMAELATKTNATGYFYLGNVVTTETYTVTFSKDGWDSQSRTVSGLENLSLNDITAATPVDLEDTTAPVLSSYTITTGNSEAEGRKISIHFNMTETGSGATKVYISTSDDFSSVEPVNYANPLSCYVPDVAGTHTLYVKVQDKAGNMSEVKEQNYTVADYKTVVTGVLVDNEDGLNDGVITWTKNRSPYYVTGNILVDSDTTLVIEPGVNVQFSGAYFMQVEGKLLANGTEAENVYFYGVGAGENNWAGIKGVFNKGSKLSNSTLTNMKNGLQGYLDIEDSEIHAASNSYALGISDSSPYSGTIRDSVIDGRINTSYARFNTCSIMLPTGSSYRSSTYRTDFYESTVSGGYLAVSDGASNNSSFQSVALTYEYFTSVNTGFNGCSLSITGGMIYLSELNNCTFSKFNYGTINDSNIIGCGTISTSIKKSDHPKFSLTGNYWGETNTSEINRNGVNSNLSFIVDYYDDFNVTRMDLSGYKTTPIAEAGRKAIEFTEPEYEIGDVGPAGGYIFYDKGYYSDGWRYLEAAPSDIKIGSSNTFVFGYCREFDEGNNIRTGTGYGIGTGRVNTELLVADMGESAYSESSGSSKSENYAARLCQEYEMNGYDDWFLPSRDELNLMYTNLHKNGVGSFDYDYYWSSSEYNVSTFSAWYQHFSSGDQDYVGRNYKYRVRAVRAF